MRHGLRAVVAFVVSFVVSSYALVANAAPPSKVEDKWTKPSYPSSNVKANTTEHGTGAKSDWGDHVILNVRGPGQWATTWTKYEFRIGQKIEPTGLEEGVVGMQVGEKRKITIEKQRSYYSWDDEAPSASVYEVELVKLFSPPKPEQPQAWTQPVTMEHVRFNVGSSGLSDLELKWRGRWVPMTVPRSWWGSLERGTASVPLIDCTTGQAPRPSAFASVNGALKAELCTWELGKRNLDEWKPQIGTLRVTLNVDERLGKAGGANESAKIELSFTPDFTVANENGDPIGTPTYGSYVVASDKFSLSAYAEPQNGLECNDNHSHGATGRLCLGPFLYMLTPNASRDQLYKEPDSNSYHSTYYSSSSSDLTKLRYKAALTYQVGPRSDPIAREHDGVHQGGFGWLFSDAGIVIIALVIGLASRALTAKARKTALLDSQPSPFEKLETGGKFWTFVGMSLVYAYVTAMWRNDPGRAYSSFWDVTDTGKGSATTALFVCTAMCMLGWVILGAREASSNGILKRLALSVPVVYAAAHGVTALGLSTGLVAFASGDAALRYFTFGRFYAPSREEECGRLTGDIRALKDPSEWKDVALRASKLFAAAGDLGQMLPETRAVFAATYVMVGMRQEASRFLGDAAATCPPWALPYAALVKSANSDASAEAIGLYERALEVPMDSHPLELALRATLSQLFPAAVARTRVPRLLQIAERTRPDWAWAIEASARAKMIDGSASGAELASVALDNPAMVKGREEHIVESVLSSGDIARFASTLMARLNTDNALTYLPLLDALASFGVPFPALSQKLGSTDAMDAKQKVQCAHVLLRAGEALAALAVARRVTESAPMSRAALEPPVRPLLGWIFARCAVATGDETVIQSLLRDGEAGYGVEAMAELAIALGDKQALRTHLSVLKSGSFAKWRKLVTSRAEIAVGDRDDALETLSALPAGSPEADLLCARIGVWMKEPNAISALDALTKTFPFWAEAHYVLGCAHVAVGNYDQAAAALRTAAEAGYSRAYTTTAELTRRHAKAKGLTEWLTRVTNNPSSALDAMVDAFWIAMAANEISIADAAHRWLERRLRDWPRFGGISGALAEARRDFAAARDGYGRAENWERLGMLALKQNDMQSAIEALERIPDRDFDGIRSLGVLDAIAVCASSRDDLPRMDRALNAMLVLAPDDSVTKQNLAGVRLARAATLVREGASGAVNDARELLADGYKRTQDPRLARGVTDLLLVQIRNALTAGSARDRARVPALLAEVKPLAPRDPRCAFYEAAFHLRAGEPRKADAALASVGENVWAAYLRGMACSKSGDLKNAEQLLSQALVADDPKLATAAYVGLVALRSQSAGSNEGLATLLGGDA